ncbi:flagellar biosynthesis regulator FlaF [Parvularcula oceani]|uniref:flagellar biosynthesis regulator FlaF n=1 Tax=Parvularcula oceani TaxID=1247963 RepID=UPI00068D1AC8|nr:flagellar biosynthesis regulator FlaF [Parvularcula oceani]
MYSSAEQGYAHMRRQTSSPRAIERSVLTRAASDLAAADPDTLEGYKALAEAVRRNTKIWSAMATDLASSANGLPDDLRGQLLSLAVFAEKHGRKVLSGQGDRQVLININRAVAKGLEAAAQEAA